MLAITAQESGGCETKAERKKQQKLSFHKCKRLHVLFKDNLQWQVCTLSTKRVLSTQRLWEVFAVDWDLGTNGIFCYHGRYQHYFQSNPWWTPVKGRLWSLVRGHIYTYKYICKYIFIYGLEMHSSWEFWGGSCLLLFPSSPNSAVPASCAVMRELFLFKEQGNFFHMKKSVQLNLYSLPLR